MNRTWTVYIVFSLLLLHQVSAQTLTGAEYFFDQDPGVGNGINIPVVQGDSIFQNVGAPIANLALGNHVLYVRALDINGSSSISQQEAFFVFDPAPAPPAQISSAEYFFDKDPGVGNGVSISVTQGDSVSQNVVAPIGTLGAGHHTLYVRAWDLAGNTSLARQENFIVFDPALQTPALLVGAEYFFDKDPGIGNGVSIPIAQGDSVSQNVVAPIGTLGAGHHTLYVRALDLAGNTSLARHENFIVFDPALQTPAQLSAAEYFFDKDPGVGNGVSIPVTQGDSVSQNVVAPIGTLGAGHHTLYVRSWDLAGNTSLARHENFIVFDPALQTPALLVGAEYFFGQDPGVGNGVSIPITQGDSISQTVVVPIGALSPGYYVLYVRAWDQAGSTSLSQRELFIVFDPAQQTIAPLASAEYFFDHDPGVGNGVNIPIAQGDSVSQNVIAPIGTLGAGHHTLYVRAWDLAGNSSLARHENFIVFDPALQTPAQLSAAEYFFDKDPGIGNGVSISVTQGDSVSQNVVAPIGNLSAGHHVLYMRAWDLDGNISLTQPATFIVVDPAYQSSSQIVAAEYFFDQDPGIGNGGSIPITQGDSISQTVVVPIGALSPGYYVLYVRVWDLAGNTSLSQRELFIVFDPAQQTIAPLASAEYFFDHDPGVGNGINISIAQGDSVSQNVIAPIGNLAVGHHVLYVRASDLDGNTSISRPQAFIVFNPAYQTLAQLSAAEYFFDHDPGIGNGISIPVTQGDSISQNVVAPIGNLSVGHHVLYVRAWDLVGSTSIFGQEAFIVFDPAYQILTPLSAAEYFFDKDPGIGNGVNIPVTQGDSISQNVVAPIGNLTVGLHVLYLRAWDLSGGTSLTQQETFIVFDLAQQTQAQLVAAEYFFDKDPGIGNGVSIPVTQGDSLSQNVIAPIGNLGVGLHVLYVRARDLNGRTSISRPETFIVVDPAYQTLSPIAAAEYFFDKDPGIGNGVNIPITAGDSVSQSVSIPLSNFSAGYYVLYVRVWDLGGKISLTQRQAFVVFDPSLQTAGSIAGAEYFFDIDPGVGNGINIPIAQGDSVSQTVIAGIGNLSSGFHLLYVRAWDLVGKTSLTRGASFIVFDPALQSAALLASVEYFFDKDPGVGNGINIPIIQGDSVSQNVVVPIGNLGAGQHTLYVRARDLSGETSLTRAASFIVLDPGLQNPAQLVGAEYFFDIDPGIGNGVSIPIAQGDSISQTVVAPIGNLPMGFHVLHVRAWDLDGSSSFTQRHPFVVFDPSLQFALQLAGAEYFFDKDPGVGNGVSIPIIQGDSVAKTVVAPIGNLSPGHHAIYVRSWDLEGKVSISRREPFLLFDPAPQTPALLAGAEYFFDQDPGIGNGVSIPINQADSVSQTVVVPIGGLTAGYYLLYVRVWDLNGSASLTQRESFIVFDPSLQSPGSVSGAEYFFDQDPGIGNGISIPIAQGDSVSQTVIAPIGNLSIGHHVLYVRAWDLQDKVSISRPEAFIVFDPVLQMTSPISNAEYFFDKDPGVGNGISIPITTQGDSISQTVAAPLGGLSTGHHILYVRAWDLAGNTALARHEPFIVFDPALQTTSLLTAAEYFFDKDPGIGNGTSIPIAQGNSTIQNVIAPIGNLGPGHHVLYVRVRDLQGSTSLTQQESFLVLDPALQSPAVLLGAEYFFDKDPGIGNGIGIPITQGDSISQTVVAPTGNLLVGHHILYVRAWDLAGSSSFGRPENFIVIDPALQTPALLAGAEYFFDKDPGVGNGVSIPIVQGNSVSQNVVAPIGSLPAGHHVLYVRAWDLDGKASLSQHQAFIVFDPSQQTPALITAAEYFFDRDPGVGNAINIPITQGNSISQNVVAPVGSLAAGQHVLYVRVWDLDGNASVLEKERFYVQPAPGTPIPIVRGEFFFGQDPGVGMGFPIDFTKGNSISVAVDTIVLNSPVTGSTTMGVRVRDSLGHWSLPLIDSLDILTANDVLGEASTINLFPNPAREIFFLTGERLDPGEMQVIIRNISGQIVIEDVIRIDAGQLNQVFNISFLASGIYTTELLLNGKKQVFRLVVTD